MNQLQTTPSISLGSSSLSTAALANIVDRLKSDQHRDSTKKNYYLVWKSFNQFYLKLDRKPTQWSDRITLFIGYLIETKHQSSTVKSYLSALRAVLKENNIPLHEDVYLMSALTKACKYNNDTVHIRMPIQKTMLKMLLKQLTIMFD